MIKKIIISILIISFSSLSFSDEIDGIKEKIKHAEKKEDAMRIIENSGSSLNLYNYILEKKVSISHPGDLTDSDGAQYIPQLDLFFDVYMSYLDLDMKPYEAIIMTYSSPEVKNFLLELEKESID